ncbi:TPA: molecular chaperone [Klebsiella aerogenes]|uniref:fimbrial biogenesis chaperone n=1 Tax=Klebsiella sp. HSTU-Sny5 TaxID=2663238 RepID=UPI001FB68577|nr:molecular chaperone [Klebsiella sp. HSTU-Sny5]MCJ1876953.1 fimbria/pilus periplasmic chaperone [Klebsiella sp. HSTU-Sny5]HEC0404279.1 molecular chaperone [Klebsiella aerogenes]
MKLLTRFITAAVLIISGTLYANAGVIIGGTRVIFDGKKKEASISVNNPDNTPYLIQSWIETQSGKNEKPPFIITPPLYRLDKGQQNIERIILTGTVAQDKESLFWLNIKAIPSSTRTENTLQIAVKTRMKLIYRPGSLKGKIPEDVVDKLVWKRSNNNVIITNPTPYVINFNEITVGGKKIKDVGYVLPGSTMQYSLPSNMNDGNISFNIINDYGGAGVFHKAVI